MEYRIVFAGRLLPGHHPDSVRANLAQLLRLNDERQLDRLFSGQPVVLKSGVTREQALKLQALLAGAGADGEIQPLAKHADAKNAELKNAEVKRDEMKAPPAGGPALALLPIEPPSPPEAPAPLPDSPAATPTLSPASPSVSSQAPAAAHSPAGAVPIATARDPGTLYRPPTEPLRDLNSSGGGRGAYVPDEVAGLCWGGFFLNFFWAVRHGAYQQAALCFLPVANLMVPFQLLFQGRRLAWQNIRWDSPAQFNREQRWWSVIGLLVCVVYGVHTVHRIQQVRRQGLAAAVKEMTGDQGGELDKLVHPAQREQMLQ